MVAFWASIGIINDTGKLVLPFKSTNQHSDLATTLSDEPIDTDAIVSSMIAVLPKVIANTRKFIR